ncbi:MAG: deoxyribose-phosphate aldolase [Clostridia bacterium]|nr:deoxyribose-phosphate aldolase [Deltaproteobacteria bacterium]
MNVSDAGCDSGVCSNCDSCRGCHVRRPADVRNIVHLGAVRIAAGIGNDSPPSDIAPLIDHTLLKADASRDELKKLCDEAKKYGFATVCVNPVNVRYCASQLEGSSTKAIAVVGFPLGASLPSAKAFETRQAIRDGAQEIDMVINIAALKAKDYAAVLDDICAVVGVSSKPVKVILETAMLTDDEKIIASTLSKVAGAAFVKTSTGFGPGGATAHDVALMRRIVGTEMGVKASGGIRTTEDAREMINAGATRLGASASVGIVTGIDAKTATSKTKKTGSY